MKQPIITIAGSLGSGKSSTAKAVASTLGYKHFSSGDLFRKIAAERGVSIEEISLQPDVDREVDGLLQKMGQEERDLVLDSRMAWHWMPESFKVFLFLDPQVAAERIFNDVQKGKRVSEHGTTVEEMRASIDRRFAIEQQKYARLYNVDPTESGHFDLIVDTKENDLQTVIAKVLSAYEIWQND